MTTDIKNIADEELEKKDTERFEELSKKSTEDLTEDEKKELGEIKERYSGRAQKRIDKLTWEKKSALERAETAEKKAREIEERLAEAERTKSKDTPITIEHFKEIGGKKYYTDEALLAMVKKGELSDTEAYKYQRERDIAELTIQVEKNIEERKVKQEDNKIRKEDAEKVLSENPNFDPKHPDHNPNDPLYIKANELWNESYKYNPRGFSLAVKRAKEILRITDTRLDRGDELNLDSSRPPERRSKEKEITLSNDELEAAERLWRDKINPATQREYTQKEIHAKALAAKKRRIEEKGG